MAASRNVDAAVKNVLAHYRGTDDDDEPKGLLFTAIRPSSSDVRRKPFMLDTEPNVAKEVFANEFAVEGSGDEEFAFTVTHDATNGLIRFENVKGGWKQIFRVSSDRSGNVNPKYENPSMEFFEKHDLGQLPVIQQPLKFMNLGEEIFIYVSSIDDVYSVRSTHEETGARWQNRKRKVSEPIVQCMKTERCTRPHNHRGQCRQW